MRAGMAELEQLAKADIPVVSRSYTWMRPAVEAKTLNILNGILIAICTVLMAGFIHPAHASWTPCISNLFSWPLVL